MCISTDDSNTSFNSETGVLRFTSSNSKIFGSRTVLFDISISGYNYESIIVQENTSTIEMILRDPCLEEEIDGFIVADISIIQVTSGPNVYVISPTAEEMFI